MPQTLDNLTYTWNNSGTTFTGIKFNVTDTASAAASNLMDLQVGGASKFKVGKSGALQFNSNATAYINGGTGTGPFLFLTDYFAVKYTTGEILLRANGSLVWSSNTGNVFSSPDLYITRDGSPNTLAQRNGVNAQTSRLYGTYTDASNYRRLTKTMSAAGVAEIKPEGAGTGATGNVLHISGLPTSNPGAGILWNDAGTVKVGT